MSVKGLILACLRWGVGDAPAKEVGRRFRRRLKGRGIYKVMGRFI